MLLDTNVLMWMAEDDRSLGSRAARRIHVAERIRDLRFSSASMMEIARLHARDRIELRKAPELWQRDLFSRGVWEIPVTSDVAILAVSLADQHGFHSDPSDQLIAATAIRNRMELATSDRKILRWAEGRSDLRCVDARR